MQLQNYTKFEINLTILPTTLFSKKKLDTTNPGENETGMSIKQHRSTQLKWKTYSQNWNVIGKNSPRKWKQNIPKSVHDNCCVWD